MTAPRHGEITVGIDVGSPARGFHAVAFEGGRYFDKFGCESRVMGGAEQIACGAIPFARTLERYLWRAALPSPVLAVRALPAPSSPPSGR